MEFIQFYVSSFWVFLGITIALNIIVTGIVKIVKIIAITIIKNKRKEMKSE